MIKDNGKAIQVKSGKVIMLPVAGKDKLHLDKDSIGDPLEPLIKEIFEPYLNQTINITIMRKDGKVKRLTIEEVL
jgi:hypothetical protein